MNRQGGIDLFYERLARTMLVISVMARPISAKITPQRRNAAKNLSSAISAVMQETGLAAPAHSSQKRP